MHIAQNWRLKAQRYALRATRCEMCQTVYFPPRLICPTCRERAAEARQAMPVAVKVGAEAVRIAR
ncbi:MAG: zinc ribbon domain-containing protein [Anaerolineae bacterium]|nr:zinc ribbon domain-containing protein [Anaerolineae bacterium]MDW8298197.1 zinc ribbon domain-containing protein [Anaerolineae bacterium]